MTLSPLPPRRRKRKEKKSHFESKRSKRHFCVRKSRDKTEREHNSATRRPFTHPPSSTAPSTTDTTWPPQSTTRHISPLLLPGILSPSPSLVPFLPTSGAFWKNLLVRLSSCLSLRSSLSVRTESLPFSDSSERASETRHPPPRPLSARQSALCSTIVACNEAYSESGSGDDCDDEDCDGTETEKGTEKRRERRSRGGITQEEHEERKESVIFEENKF